MSKCDLEISFEGDKRDYQIGDTVRGVVTVDVNAPCTCNNLTLGQQWRTHGRGNRAVGPTEPKVLFAGKWEEPGTYTYPFELKMPAGPLTYRGNHINVDWYIDARADIPWAIDPKAHEEVNLTRGDYDGELVHGKNVDMKQWTDIAPEDQSKIKVALIGCAGLFLLPFLLASIGITAIGVSKVLNNETDGWPILFFGLSFAVVPLIPVALFFWKKLAERKLGKVDLSVQPTAARPGDELKCAIRFTPQTDAQVDSVTISLTGMERAVSGSGSNRRTHKSDFHNSSQEVMARRQFHKGEYVALQAKIVLPKDAVPTFHASDNRVVWQISVHIDIPGWPDWNSHQHIMVG
jgi:hypothetical protein